MPTEKQQGQIHETISEFDDITLLPDKEALANDIIELVKEQSYIGQVTEFMTLFKQDVGTTPALPSKEVMKLRLALILEELTELAEACGKEVSSLFVTMLHNKSEELHIKTERKIENKGNIIDVLDAHVDLQYVLSGSVIAFGLQDIFDDGFEEVQNSNLSKACKTLDEAESTKGKYESQGVECYIEEDKENNVYLVKRTGDKKLLKSVNYTEANLKKFF